MTSFRVGPVVAAAAVVIAVAFPFAGRSGSISASTRGSFGSRSAVSVLAGQVPLLVRNGHARPAGRLAPGRKLLVSLGLPLRHQRQIDWFIKHEALHGHYMSQSQFNRRFSPTASHMARIEKWARTHYLRLVYARPGGLVVTVRGTVARFDHLFRVRIRRYLVHGHMVYSNSSGPSVPRFLDIQTVTGLDNIRHEYLLGPRPHAIRRGDIPAGGLTPDALRTAYDMSGYSVNGTPVDGTGQTIGITGFGQSVPDSDFRLFAQNLGGPEICTTCADKLQWFELDGHTNDPSIDEQALDVEYVHGLAPHSQIKYWLGDDGSDPGMEDAVDAASKDPSIHVVSNSWGDPGAESASSTNPFVKSTANMFKRAVAVGTTFYFSTGDNAADSGCLDISSRCGLPSYPADSPYVVAVGGTNLQLNHALTSWASETTWNLDSGDEGSGGGCAPWFTRPSWQTGVSVATCVGRAIPDISAAADLNNSPVIVYVNGGPVEVGGTSVSASLISGMAAASNRYLGLEHAIDASVPSTMGFSAPEIYKLATSGNRAAYYHDVLCGSNKWPARFGWDQATGWGAPDWHTFTEGFAGQSVPHVSPAPHWQCSPGTGVKVSLNSVSCYPSYHCHLGGSGGKLLSAADGWHWSGPANSTASSNVIALNCPSQYTCYAVGRNGWLQKSTDGGKSFRAQKLLLSSPMAIACPSKNNCVVVGNGIVSTSNGKRFARQNDPVSGTLIGVSCSSARFCVAMRSDGAAVESVNGGPWRLLNTGSAPQGTISSVSCPSPSQCFAAGAASTPNSSGGRALIFSTRNDATWSSQVVTGTYGPLSAINCSASNVCDAVGTAGSVLRTTDGVNWAGFLTTNPAVQLNAINCPSRMLCVAAGANGRVFQIGAAPGN